MRSQLALLVTSLLLPLSIGCAHGPRCDEAARTPAVSFAGVRGWGPLTWEMTMPQARAALDHAQVEYSVRGDPCADQDTEVRGRHDLGPQQTRGIANGIVQIELASRWTGMVTFAPGPQGQILGVFFQRGAIGDEAAADLLLAERVATYGPATIIGIGAANAANATTKQHVWQNGSTQLLLTVWADPSTNEWQAYEQWTRLGR